MEGMTAAHQEEFEQQEVLVQELIKESLAASGALPGEDVVLTGHSGGGIHAAAAAADPGIPGGGQRQDDCDCRIPRQKCRRGGGIDVWICKTRMTLSRRLTLVHRRLLQTG